MAILPFVAAVAVVTGVAPVSAAPLTIGTPTGNNCFPFGCHLSGAASTTYQQVYAASAFVGGPLAISGLSFISTSGAPNGGTYTLSLSTTPAAVNGLDLATFANNVGGDNTQVFSGSLAGQFSGGVLSFSFAPFIYDPTVGNLLLNISVAGNPVTGLTNFFQAMNGDSGGLFSRAHDFGIVFANSGLVTTFDVRRGDQVPEPTTGVLLILGGAVARFTARRRRCMSRSAS
jgi:hypothetical protein